jgi:hypothetical protein
MDDKNYDNANDQTQEEREEELFEKRCRYFKVLPPGIYMINPKTIVAQLHNSIDDEQAIDDLPDKLKKHLYPGKKMLYMLAGYESKNPVILNRIPPRLGSLTNAQGIYYDTYKLNVPYKCTLVFALTH